MRIVIDMQGAQSTASRGRGIGRYSMSLAREIVRCSEGREIVLALNGAFPDAIEAIRIEFDGLLPPKYLLVWQPPEKTYGDGLKCQRLAEMTYEAFLASLKPDFILVTSLFEGLGDESVTCIHHMQRRVPVAVILYDLIPYLNPDIYQLDERFASWYQGKVEQLRRADVWLAISESSRQEGIEHLGLPQDGVINISTDADECFRQVSVSQERETDIKEKYGLTKPFLMYTGGIDQRKNVEGLIRAYAGLPDDLRQSHQLAIICSIQQQARLKLSRLANRHGLKSNEIVFTGFVPEDDLIALYNLCKLFVFPSWHEGFGLPVLEAMRCGAPVIAANTSSLPEVVGLNEALFDPHSDEAMTRAMVKGLTDQDFRKLLSRNGNKQSNRFSWHETAQRVLAAMAASAFSSQTSDSVHPDTGSPKRLAYVSPLPPARSGIADYSAALLRKLHAYYEIDVIVDQEEEADDPWVRENFPLRSVKWFRENAHRYERVLYHFGNSHFHQHMFDLLDDIPGVVVLHDFFLSGIQAHRDVTGVAPRAFAQALYSSHGYGAVREWYSAQDTAEIVWCYPANISVLQRALGVIVHSEHSRVLARQWYGSEAGADWHVIPLLRNPPPSLGRSEARQQLGLTDDDLLVCSFGLLGPSKMNDRLLKAWLNSPLATNPAARLVFVGENHGGEYGKDLMRTIKENRAGGRISITGWAGADTFHQYLAAADIAVQLRTLSRGETSAAVLDCMNSGLATIVNANGSMADLDPSSVLMLPDEFDDDALIKALVCLAENQTLRVGLGERAAHMVRDGHAPEACALAYANALEDTYACAEGILPGLLRGIAKECPPEDALPSLAIALARNFPPRPRRRQWLVDVSELVKVDVGSGIQRVVRAIVHEWLSNPPEGYQVEPVYATTDQVGYRYARVFTSRLLGMPDDWLQDDPVEAWSGDVFVGLDLNHGVADAQQAWLKSRQVHGVKVWFVVYDLLPVLLPHCFPDQALMLHQRWLEAVSQFDGVACISSAVAEEMRDWLEKRDMKRGRPLEIRWFHLGADVSASVPSCGMPPESKKLLRTLKNGMAFLMVGTIEPRKGHAQVLDAFEEIWRREDECRLVIVGKQGWMVEHLMERFESHPENGKRLFVLNGISDEYLESLYSASTCLIAASYGEGFGLPLIEAAKHNVPIIARDIPIFREVGGEGAFYFKSGDRIQLAETILEWKGLYLSDRHPSPNEIKWTTWSESALALTQRIEEGKVSEGGNISWNGR